MLVSHLEFLSEGGLTEPKTPQSIPAGPTRSVLPRLLERRKASVSKSKGVLLPFSHPPEALEIRQAQEILNPATGYNAMSLLVTQEMTFWHIVTVLSHASCFTATKILPEVTCIDTAENLTEVRGKLIIIHGDTTLCFPSLQLQAVLYTKHAYNPICVHKYLGLWGEDLENTIKLKEENRLRG